MNWRDQLAWLRRHGFGLLLDLVGAVLGPLSRMVRWLGSWFEK
jgi:hypothetical protein